MLKSISNRLTQEGALHVLFVCTGNICRSPTAERLAEAYSARLHLQHFKAASAGTRAVIGHPIHRQAAEVLEDLGGNASKFSARQLSPKLVSDADLILAMAAHHRDKVLELAPHCFSRTFMLTEASRLVSQCDAQVVDDLAGLRQELTSEHRPDIADPIGQSAGMFAAVGEQIAELLVPVMELLQRSAIATVKADSVPSIPPQQAER